MRKLFGIAVATALAVAAAGLARADEAPLKIGVIMTYSGPFATYGHQADLGIQTYMKQFGDTIAGRKIEIVKKDDTGPHPDVAKRDAQDLIVQDKVDLILGGDWSNDALASVPVVNEAKIPFLLMVAATDGIPAKSPYMARLSESISAPNYALGKWAGKQGWKTGYNAVVDYIFGAAAGTAFQNGLEAGGGKIVGEVRIPVGNPNFVPYVQRIEDAHPQVINLSLPAGSMPEGFVKAYHEVGLLKKGIKLVTGPMSETQPTESLGDYVVGIYDATNWIVENKTPANQAFLKTFREIVGPNTYPGFVAMSLYDALNITRQVLEQQHGKVVPDQFMAAIDNHQFTSPRGPIAFDKDGEIIQNLYLRHAELVNGKLEMKLIETIPMVHAPIFTH